MDFGETAPAPGKHHEDRPVDDPASQDLRTVLRIADEPMPAYGARSPKSRLSGRTDSDVA